ELACRAYMREPEPVDEANWPTPLDERAEPTRATLRRVLEAIAAWVRE
ncbi:MAG: N-formylglutamate deformylase, partial [Hyphomicrobiales bacterium]|nr:N-formylglutamate deformylase [Hyphomicrobiales bacterium]